MKPLKISLLALASLAVFSCSSDDDTPPPVVVNQEELITTLTVTLTPSTDGEVVTLQTKDLDGDGPNPPEVTVSGNLVAETTYSGTIVLLNETESPAENITEEVQKEDKEHQFFYTIGGAVDATTTYTSTDGDGNPLGVTFDLAAGVASSGTLTFTLRHEPKKPNTGLEDAGGETDIETTFDITIE